MLFKDFVQINPKVDLKKGKTYPYVGMADVNPSRGYVTNSETREYKNSRSKFKEGDTLFARITPCLENGKITRFKSDGIKKGFGSTEFFVFRAKEGVSNPNFVYYLSRSPLIRKTAEKSMVGASGRQRADITAVEEVEIDPPDLPTQQKIASILSAFDDLIENNTWRIEILEEMTRRIYREWFVHFRYPRHEEDVLVDSDTDEFEAVPEGWDMQVVDDILEHYIGGTWGEEEPEGEKNNPAYVIRGTDIPGGRSGNVDDIPLRYHKQSYINSRRLQHGDIVFEGSGGSKDQPVGRAMLITDTFLSELDCDDVVHASFCKLLRSDKSILKPEILYLHIREIYDDRRIMKYQVQSTGITNFKFTFFAENKQMFIPPIKLQEKFQERVIPLFNQMYILGKQINRLKETRDLLLPKLISGKIDVGEFNLN